MSKPAVLSALLLALAVAVPSIAAPTGRVAGFDRPIRALAQDAAQQLYQIYSDSSFAQSSKELEALIARLEALFKASPEMRTTRVRGQGDLTGDQLMANLKASLEKLGQQEGDAKVNQVLQAFAKEIYSYPNSPEYWLKSSNESVSVVGKELQQLVKESIEIVALLKKYLNDNPAAVTTQIQIVGNQYATGAQLLTDSQSNVTRNSEALKQFNADRLAQVKSEASSLSKAPSLSLALERARKEAASKQLTVLRNAGYTYQGAINDLESTINGLKNSIQEVPAFATESIQISGKTQSVQMHIADLTIVLKKAQAEFKAFQPKWKAALAEFDRQTAAELKKLLAGDRKVIFAARGWPMRSAGVTDSSTPLQIVQLLVKAPFWTYNFRNANDVYCTYTYYFQGNKIIRTEKAPEAFC